MVMVLAPARPRRAHLRRRLGLCPVGRARASPGPSAAAAAGAGPLPSARRTLHPDGGGNGRTPAGRGRTRAVGALHARNVGRGCGHLPHLAMARLSRLPRPDPRDVAAGAARLCSAGSGPGSATPSTARSRSGVIERRIVLPGDFSRRYNPVERRLALEHELVHHKRGDIMVESGRMTRFSPSSGSIRSPGSPSAPSGATRSWPATPPSPAPPRSTSAAIMPAPWSSRRAGPA